MPASICTDIEIKRASADCGQPLSAIELRDNLSELAELFSLFFSAQNSNFNKIVNQLAKSLLKNPEQTTLLTQRRETCQQRHRLELSRQALSKERQMLIEEQIQQAPNSNKRYYSLLRQFGLKPQPVKPSYEHTFADIERTTHQTYQGLTALQIQLLGIDNRLRESIFLHAQKMDLACHAHESQSAVLLQKNKGKIFDTFITLVTYPQFLHALEQAMALGNADLHKKACRKMV